MCCVGTDPALGALVNGDRWDSALWLWGLRPEQTVRPRPSGRGLAACSRSLTGGTDKDSIAVPEAERGFLFSVHLAFILATSTSTVHGPGGRTEGSGRGMASNMSLSELSRETHQQLLSLISQRHVMWSCLAAREAGKCLL